MIAKYQPMVDAVIEKFKPDLVLTFEVDFSAYGSFSDAQSTPEDATSL